MTGSEARDLPVGGVERASCCATDNVVVSQCRHVSLVKLSDDNPHSATKPLEVTPDEVAPGLTARVDLVASQVGTLPSCSPLTADEARSETLICCILSVRP